MAVPEEIRKAERPKNTKVIDRGGSGIRRYAVISRRGCKRVNGRNIPVEGGTIGHIINGRYVPCDFQPSLPPAEMKDYANVMLIDSLSRDLLDELRPSCGESDALKIYAAAILKACNPDLRNFMVFNAYEESWVSELFPGLLSDKSTLTEFKHKADPQYAGLVDFMRKRAGKMSGGRHIAVDGFSVAGGGTGLTLSSYLRKTSKKETEDISVIYAYDVETREPVCGKVYAGNVADYEAYRDFLTENNITDGVIIRDRDFPGGGAAGIFEKNREIKWLCPLNRDGKETEKYRLTFYEGRLCADYGDVLFKKVCANGYWLYSFRDRALAAKEEEDYYRRNAIDEFNMEDLAEKKNKFGTLVLKSNADLLPEIIYGMFSRRRIIREYFKTYGDFGGFDGNGAGPAAFSEGIQLINFTAAVMISRVMNKLEQTGLLDKYTFGEIMTVLDRAKKVRTGPDGQWRYMRLTKEAYTVLALLNLADIGDAPPEYLRENPKSVRRKPGRPRKYPG